MKASDLRERITIMRDVEGHQDEGGGWHPGGPEPVATVYAKVNPVSGRERIEARAVQATAMYRITIRRRTDLDESDWIEWGGEKFNIRFLPRVSSKESFMTLDAELAPRRDDNGS